MLCCKILRSVTLTLIFSVLDYKSMTCDTRNNVFVQKYIAYIDMIYLELTKNIKLV